ncbi:hypothetical protein RLIN73S_06319 [Rhodanobacter lindaniclasticus]
MMRNSELNPMPASTTTLVPSSRFRFDAAGSPGAGCRPSANQTTASIATTMAITANTNRITSRRLLPRTRACWAKKSMEAPTGDQRHRVRDAGPLS